MTADVKSEKDVDKELVDNIKEAMGRDWNVSITDELPDRRGLAIASIVPSLHLLDYEQLTTVIDLVSEMIVEDAKQ